MGNRRLGAVRPGLRRRLRDADNAAGYRDALRAYRRFGKPVAVTEFGCCTYRGAADRGGMGWKIVDEKSDPPNNPGTIPTRTATLTSPPTEP